MALKGKIPPKFTSKKFPSVPNFTTCNIELGQDYTSNVSSHNLEESGFKMPFGGRINSTNKLFQILQA